MAGSLTAAGERVRLAVPRRVRRAGIALAVAVSVLLHAGVVWLLLPHGAVRPGVESPPVFEVELVDQAPKVQGAPAEAEPTQPPPSPPIPRPPPQPAGELPSPPPPAPQPTEEAPPGPPVVPSTVNIGGDDVDQEGLTVSGPNVVPPRPDALFHNKPPGYPAEAVRRHAEGTVSLRTHVTESGVPGWVDVLTSSGDSSLDRSAQEAVALWRFQPARDHGVAVPFDLTIRFNFTLHSQ